MPTTQELKAALKKAGASNTMSARLALVDDELDAQEAQQEAGFQSSVAVKPARNSLCWPAKILNIEEKPTEGKNGMPDGKMTNILFLNLPTNDRTPIPIKDGKRDEKGRIWMTVVGEQMMTETQQKAAAAAKEKTAKGKRGGGAAKKKITFSCHDVMVTRVMKATIFEGKPVHPKTRQPFKKDDIVMITGPYPKQKFEPNEDENVHKPVFGIQWTFGQLMPDPDEDVPGGRQGSGSSSDWKDMMEENYLLNFWKGPGGGWSTDFMTEEDRAQVAKWRDENKMDDNRFKISIMGLSKENLEHLNDLVVIPLFFTAKNKQPFHLARRYSVRFTGVHFGNNWVEKYPGANNTQIESAIAEVQCIAKVTTVHSTARVTRSKVLVQLNLNARYDPDNFYRFGIVNLERWRNLAAVFMPYVSGFIVGQMNTQATEMLPVNQPALNRLKANGEMSLGANYGIQCFQFYTEPDLATLILSPTAFQVNISCVKYLMRASLSYDNPVNAPSSEWARKNPLNTGSRNVINMFETNDRPENLSEEYDFFLLYGVDESAFTAIASTRADLEKAKLDPVKTWSTIFESDKADPAKELFKLNSLPMPKFLNKANEYKYCVFAVRKTEVERVHRGPADMPADEFAKRMIEIEEEETAKYGPLLDEGPPPAKNNGKRAPSVEPSTVTAKGKRSTGGRRRAGASTAADDEGPSQGASQADTDFFDQ